MHSFLFAYSSLLAKARSSQASEMSIAKYSPFFLLVFTICFFVLIVLSVRMSCMVISSAISCSAIFLLI